MFGNSSERLCSSIGNSAYLMNKIREAQKMDKEIAKIKERMRKGKAKGFHEDEHDALWFEDRVYVLMTPRSGS